MHFLRTRAPTYIFHIRCLLCTDCVEYLDNFQNYYWLMFINFFQKFFFSSLMSNRKVFVINAGIKLVKSICRLVYMQISLYADPISFSKAHILC